MKKLMLVLVLIFAANANILSQSDFHRDRILVKLKDNVQLKNVRKDMVKGSIASTGNKNIDLLDEKYSCNQIKNEFADSKDPVLSKWRLFTFDKKDNFDQLLNDYKGNSELFEKVETYPIPIVSYTPNDPLFEPNGCKAMYDINMPQAWDVELGNGNVVVGIIDNGLDWRHPDISMNNIKQNISSGAGGYGEDADRDGHTLEIINGQIQLDPGDLNGIDDDGDGYVDDLVGWDFYYGTNNILPDNPASSHGTSMFGIIAATGNNNTGALGVAFNNKVLHCKAGEGGYIQGDYISAIYYLANRGVKVINMSFFHGYPSTAEQDAINYAYQRDCVIVACAGFTPNGLPSNSYTYPASCDNVISASVLQGDANLMRLSTYVNDKVDILGSQYDRYPYYEASTQTYEYGYSMHSSGTTALCSGLAALLFSHNPTWNNDIVVNQILTTCTNKDDLNRASSNEANFDFYGLIGNGLLNAYKALTFYGTINENTIWSKHLKIFPVINVNSGITLTLRPGSNLEFQPGKSFNVYGDLIVQGDLTINTNINIMNGGTIQILHGSQITFKNNSSLIINGTLTAQGTSTNPITFKSTDVTPGSWGTITLSGSGANGSTIQYANIEYGTQIDVINANNITIQNCSITNSSMYGINFSGSTGSALSNTIANSNIAHGIIVQNGSNVTCNDNVIYKTTQNQQGVGIYFTGGGTGYVARNDIRYYFWGIGAAWGSSPYARTYYSTGRNNRITNCIWGLMVYEQSYPVFGTPPPSDYQWNSIYNNTHNVGVNAEDNNLTSSLAAYGNWWGISPPNTSLFTVGSQGQFYYVNYLSSDPWSGIPLPLIRQLPGINIAATSSISSRIESPNSNPVPITLGTDGSVTPSNSPSVIDSLLFGINLRANNKNREAKDYFLSYLKVHPDNQAAYVYLYNCADSSTTPELIDYFKSLPKGASKEHKLLLSYLYLRGNKIDLAKEVNNNLIDQNPNTPLAVRAMLNNLYIALYNENNIDKANAILNQVKSQADLSNPMEISTAQQALYTYQTKYTANPDSSIKKQLAEGDENKPTSYALSQNYPNPFNPSTTITYTLPEEGMVTIKVFNTLGQEIKTLINDYTNKGSHSIMWDGKNNSGQQVTSGIYFYNVTFKGNALVKKMLMIK